MGVHDWTRVDAGIFHAFHLSWIMGLTKALNDGLLPSEFYAFPERQWAGRASSGETGDALLVNRHRLIPTSEIDTEFYRRKQDLIAVRRLDDDSLAAMIQIISPGNKASRSAFQSLIQKAGQALDQSVHLLLIDLFPPGPRDPHGVHAAVWDEIAGQEYCGPAAKPLTLAAYETALTIRAYVQPIAVGDSIPEMPVFLEPNAFVMAPLEATYQSAFAAMPLRWRRVLDAANDAS